MNSALVFVALMLSVCEGPSGTIATDDAIEPIPGGDTTKSPALTAMPDGVVILISPVAVFAGTVKTTWVSVRLFGVTGVAFSVTVVCPATGRKLVPVTVTVVPAPPELGLNEVMAGITVNELALAVVAPATVTEIAPLVAPAGTTAISCVALADVTAATVPLNETVSFATVGSKLLPAIVTDVPTGPLAGFNPKTCGATTKLVELVAVLPPVVTVIGPVVAPAGTVTVNCVVVVLTTVAAVPLKVTVLFEAVELNPWPWIVTVVPMGPLLGEKPVIETVGVKFAPLVALRLPIVTLILPVVAPLGTDTTNCVEVAEAVVAAVPLNVTMSFVGFGSKLVPVIVTVVPTGPFVGVKLLIVGAGVVTVKLLLLAVV